MTTLGSAFAKLTSVGDVDGSGNVRVVSNNELRTFGTAFAALRAIHGYLYILYNAKLTTFGTAFTRLETVRDQVYFYSNRQLRSAFSGGGVFTKLQSIGRLYFFNNGSGGSNNANQCTFCRAVRDQTRLCQATSSYSNSGWYGDTDDCCRRRYC